MIGNVVIIKINNRSDIKVTVLDKINVLESKLEYVHDNSSHSNPEKVYMFGSVTKYLVKDADGFIYTINPSQIFQIIFKKPEVFIPMQ
jgi:hypothetical protein